MGECALSRQAINVPTADADPRFNAEVDRRSGFRTPLQPALPLLDDRDALVGVMQVLNREGGDFDADDEGLGLRWRRNARWRCRACG